MPKETKGQASLKVKMKSYSDNSVITPTRNRLFEIWNMNVHTEQ